MDASDFSANPFARWIGDPDFEAFATVIAAKSADEAPRLILADWLEERGDEVAGKMAREPNFVTRLAFARFHKIAGGVSSSAIARMVQTFNDAGKTLAVAMQPALQRMVDSIHKIQETPVQAPKRAGRVKMRLAAAGKRKKGKGKGK